MNGGYYIVLVDTNEDPVPMRGPFPSYDEAVYAHYQAAVDSGYEIEEGVDAHTYYLYDDAVRIARDVTVAPVIGETT